VISFVCVDEIQKTNKKVHTGHFAECNTRQRGSLPSVKTIALDKEPRPGHRYRFFVECNVCGTRQRA
jgi:phage terminase large subunit GpA-like protein